MKIVIDSAIPFVRGVFEPYADVVYCEGRGFTPELVKDADALIIRTRTRCDEALLSGSRVTMIATATIGFDHIDLDYCAAHGIEVATAAGCNARGVLQWVGGALALLSSREGWQPEERVIGVVGVGNVGRLIEHYAKLWGFKVLCCDPPRGVEGYLSFDELLPKVDIVTFHTPLDSSTRHMLNDRTIKLMKPNAVVINSSRGEVVDSAALRSNPSHPLMIDVWESEPEIDRELLARAVVSTTHIAGYSLQGKANGTAIAVKALVRHFGLPIEGWYPDVERNSGCEISWAEMTQTIAQYCDLEAESERLKSTPEEFETIRNSYSHRVEYF